MKIDPVADAWRSLNKSEPDKRIRLDNLSGSRKGEKRGKGWAATFSPKCPAPRCK